MSLLLMTVVFEQGFSLAHPICSSYLILLLSHNIEFVTSVISVVTDYDAT